MPRPPQTGGKRDRLFPASTAAAALLLAALYLAGAPLRAGLALDAQHHMASVRELAKGEFPPRHNLVEGHLPQGHYGPYLVALGLVARVTGLQPLPVLYAAGVVNLALFVIAMRAAAACFVSPEAANWAALAPLLLWGPWPAPAMHWPSWGWPGTTSLADSHDFFYPQQAGLVLLPAVLVLLARARGAHVLGAVAVLVAALLLATHPLTALAMVPALAALGLEERARGEASRRRLLFLACLPVMALLIAAAWPYYPVLGLLQAAAAPGLREPIPGLAAPAGALIAATGPVTRSLPVLELFGPGIAGLLGCAALALRGRPFLLAWALLDLLLSYVPLLPLRHRFVFFAAMPLHLGAMFLLEAAWSRGRLGKAAALALLLAGALSAGLRVRWLLGQEVPDLGFVARLTPENAVVLADLDTANGVAGLAGRKVVVPQHPDLFLVAAGGWQRVHDVSRFLDPQATSAEREAILRKWHVSHVLVDRVAGRDPGELPYRVLYEGAGYVLYDVRSVTLFEAREVDLIQRALAALDRENQKLLSAG